VTTATARLDVQGLLLTRMGLLKLQMMTAMDPPIAQGDPTLTGLLMTLTGRPSAQMAMTAMGPPIAQGVPTLTDLLVIHMGLPNLRMTMAMGRTNP
jgi:hypothetical protein